MTSASHTLPLLAALLAVGCATDQSLNYEVTSTPPDSTAGAEPTGVPDPAIRLSTNALEFGEQGHTCTATRDFEVFNDGNATLVVYSMALSVTSSTDFSIEDQTLTIEPNDSATVTIDYAPTGFDADTGTLLIQSNDLDSGTVNLGLSGSAAAPVNDSEYFEQTNGGPVDILLGIDTTSSAREDVGLIAARIDEIIGRLNDGGLSWQMGAVGLDPTDTGVMIGTYGEDGLSYLTENATVEEIEAFKSNIALRMAQFSTATTPGFQMMAVAVGEENLAGPHSGFLRDDARLDLVVLSVYDDDSKNQTNNLVPIDNMAQIFVDTKGSADAITFSAVVGLDDLGGSCPRQEGFRYQQMVEVLSGFADSICLHRTDDTVARMVNQFTGLQTVFELAGVPTDPESLVVTVDGSPLAQDEQQGWYFDAQANAIVFVGAGVPPTGAEIAVTFTQSAACE